MREKLARLLNNRDDLNARLSIIGEQLTSLDEKRVSLDYAKRVWTAKIAAAAAVLETLADPVVCPAKPCPVLETHHKDINDKKSHAEKNKARASTEFAKVANQYQQVMIETKTLQQERKDIGQQIYEFQEKITELNDLLRLHESEMKRKNIATPPETLGAELASLEAKQTELQQQLTTTKMTITKAETMTQRVATYNTDSQAIDKNAGDLQDATADQSKTRKAIAAMEALQRKLVSDKIVQFLAALNEFAADLKLPEIGYTWDAGFSLRGVPIAMELSDGQAEMMFEAAFRVAAAKAVGNPGRIINGPGKTGQHMFNFVMLDHKAPLDNYHQVTLSRALGKSGCQVIQTFTTDNKRGSVDGISSFWVQPAGNGEAATVTSF